MGDRNQLVRERERLERRHKETLTAVEALPEWSAYVEAHRLLLEHLVLYGTGDLSQVPTGILNAP
jgi:hypothetical protein